MARKTTRSRRGKVEITKIENGNKRGVTFSKRRVGAFKKASELSTLCRTEMAVIIISEKRKVYSYGNPSVNAILNRYMDVAPQRAVDEPFVARNNLLVQEMQNRIMETEDALKFEQQRGKMLSLNIPDEHLVEEMSMFELHYRRNRMEKLRLFFENERDSKKTHEELNAFFASIFNSN